MKEIALVVIDFEDNKLPSIRLEMKDVLTARLVARTIRKKNPLIHLQIEEVEKGETSYHCLEDVGVE
jgi:hypothetical protein